MLRQVLRALLILAVVGAQAGLVWVTHSHLNRSTYLGVEPNSKAPDWHVDIYSTGDPLPWEYCRHTTRIWVIVVDERHIERNLAVPVAAYLLAVTTPPALVGWLLLLRARESGFEWVTPRWVQLLWTAFLTSVAALTVAAVVAVATQKTCLATGSLSQFVSGPALGSYQARLSRAWPDQGDFGQSWASYTRLTLAGAAAGLVTGLVVFRPWHCRAPSAAIGEK